MHQILTVIEDKLGQMFQPEFAKAILNKQLMDIQETPDTFRPERTDFLLNQIEKKVLKSFYGEKSGEIIRDIRRRVKDVS